MAEATPAPTSFVAIAAPDAAPTTDAALVAAFTALAPAGSIELREFCSPQRQYYQLVVPGRAACLSSHHPWPERSAPARSASRIVPSWFFGHHTSPRSDVRAES